MRSVKVTRKVKELALRISRATADEMRLLEDAGLAEGGEHTEAGRRVVAQARAAIEAAKTQA
jgi:hypothetical protein